MRCDRICEKGGETLEIQISRESGVSLHLQVGRQIAVLITTGKLKPGDYLPSVRALAKRLKIHHNTISQAYRELANLNLVERRRGSRLQVPHSPRFENASRMDLDDVINAAFQMAEEQGFTALQFRERMQQRFLAQPPDHILILVDEPGSGEIIKIELEERVRCSIVICSVNDLASDRALAIGALVVGPPGNLRKASNFLPKDRPTITLTYNTEKRHVDMVRNLGDPSSIAVVSVSEFFLQTARAVLAPALGSKHTLREFLLPSEKPDSLDPFQIVFCDSASRGKVRAKHVVHYQLISKESIEKISSAITLKPY